MFLENSFTTDSLIISAHCTNILVNLWKFLSKRATLSWNTLPPVSLCYIFHLSYPQISVNLKSVCHNPLPPMPCVTVSL